MKCIMDRFHFCSYMMLPQCKAERFFSVICKNLLIGFCPRPPHVPYLFHMYTLLSVKSPPTSTHIILNRRPLVEYLPWILSLDPSEYMTLASPLRVEAVSVTLADTQMGHRAVDGPMHGADPPSFSLPLRMLQALAPLQSAFLTHSFAFQFLTCDFLLLQIFPFSTLQYLHLPK